jgi:putative ABC transport system permease protein
MLLRVAWKSLLNRRMTVLLTVLSIAVSAFVLLGVEHIRHEAKNSFSRTISGVDLIVGARTGQMNLLLYSVFRIGNPTNNISWDSYREFAAHPQVAWTIPLSLGDSHYGYRVMGTTADYFRYFRYGQARELGFSAGVPFDGVFDAVLGAEVATRLGYDLGDNIVVAHGIGSVSFARHDDKPFTVTGILAPTGTPVDQTVHISLEGIEAIHIDWQSGVKQSRSGITAEALLEYDLTPDSITAFMVGLKSRIATFQVQRQINDYAHEPLLAILPGIALAELWRMMATVENVLLLISVLVLFASLLGMSTMLLASMRERQRELAVIRAIGGRPSFVFVLIEIEAMIITATGLVLALFMLWLTLAAGQDYISDTYGVFISASFLTGRMVALMGIMLIAAFVLALFPGIVAYRSSLSGGLTIRT